jgi:thiamine-phosphate pyrophosphorylase
MTSRPPKTHDRPAPRLYLVTPLLTRFDALAQDLKTLGDEVDIAAVLLRLDPADERSLIKAIKAFAPAVQDRDAALILDRPELVARSGADGAHLANFEALQAALPALKPDRIAGVGGLITRHDAMAAAEAGADYVMFGEPDATGQRPSFDAVLERVDWWAEVFQIPCVAYAASLDEISVLIAAGADFIALGDAAFADPRGMPAALAEAAHRMVAEAPA